MKITPSMIEAGVAALARIKRQHPVDASVVAAVFSAMHSAMEGEQKRMAGIVTTKPYEHQDWPAWRYGPNGEAATFDRAEDVPEGWSDISVAATVYSGVHATNDVRREQAMLHAARAPRKPGRPPKVKTDAATAVP